MSGWPLQGRRNPLWGIELAKPVLSIRSLYVLLVVLLSAWVMGAALRLSAELASCYVLIKRGVVTTRISGIPSAQLYPQVDTFRLESMISSPIFWDVIKFTAQPKSLFFVSCLLLRSTNVLANTINLEQPWYIWGLSKGSNSEKISFNINFLRCRAIVRIQSCCRDHCIYWFSNSSREDWLSD